MNNSSPQNKRAIAGWAIYDFANTIFSMNIVTMYFAQWLVVDNKVEDIYYSISYAASMILVALTWNENRLKKNAESWKANCNGRRRWSPLVRSPAGLPMISTTY